MTAKGLSNLHPNYLQHDYTQSGESFPHIYFFKNAKETLQYFPAILPFIIILKLHTSKVSLHLVNVCGGRMTQSLKYVARFPLFLHYSNTPVCNSEQVTGSLSEGI